MQFQNERRAKGSAAVSADRTPSHFIVLTPAIAGADGISEVTRQWVRALEGLTEHGVGSLEVCSLDDSKRPELHGATRFRTAHGQRLRFVAFALRRAMQTANNSIVVVT